VFSLTLSPSAMQPAAGGIEPIAVKTADVDGLKLQYLAAGHGAAILLLHGYAETSRMWRPLMPRLAAHSRSLRPTCLESAAQIFRPTVWTWHARRAAYTHS